MSEDAAPSRLFSGASPREVAADLAPLVGFQEEGLPLEAVRTLVEERLLPHLMRYDDPSFHAMFNAFPEEGAAYGAGVALAWNQGVTNWQVSPGGAVLEELCCRALCRLFGLGPKADATVLYCGSYANQQALFMALCHRAEREGFNLAAKGLAGFRDPSRLAVVASEDAHFSLMHGVRTLGLGDSALVSVPVDARRRMDVGALRKIMEEIRGQGEGQGARDVVCVVATAGTTSAGAVDPVAEIADVCHEHGAWLHVDGAYGLAYGLVPEWAHLFRGVDRAHTVSWDPHKQMGVPIPSSLLFARDRELFRPMALFSHYWNRPDTEGPNPGVKSVPTTRPMAALPLVTSILHQGLGGVVERLRRPLNAIRDLHGALADEPDVESLHEPDTGILCFRMIPPGVPAHALDRLQESIYSAILREGRRLISVTRLGGKAALRAVAVSPGVTAESLLETVAQARGLAGEVIRFGPEGTFLLDEEQVP
jgi:glutamate/tyrosine decarboxylase-like PLP-dependent enzyme